MRGRKEDEKLDPRKRSPVVTFDYELYAHYLDDAEISEEQKRELLSALWSIIVEFVALGFEVHPAQQAQDSCGKLPESRRNPRDSGQNAVRLEEQIFNVDISEAAREDASDAAERIPE